jgi:methyltransferase (TIGR00027 family)
VSQFVILGAGFDTLAYRQPEWAGRLNIYEVDHHASQADKRARLAAAGVVLPANLDFVAIDFERTTLRDGLLASPLDFSRPTFFSCLGVLSYLTPEAVDAIFALVAEFPPGSEMVFTFGSPPPEVAAMVQASGEPFHSNLEPDALRSALQGRGFAELTILSPEEADRRYFQGRSDGLAATPWPHIASLVRDGSKRA